jgi:hypothetical protein
MKRRNCARREETMRGDGMIKTKVIEVENFPTSLVTMVERTFLIYLAIEKFSLNVIVSTVIWTLWSIIIIIGIARAVSEEKVDIFKEKYK